MSTNEAKQKIITENRIHETDTGSPEVQIGLLTQRLQLLQGHVSKHPKDNHTKRGLVKLVTKRKRLLSYIKNLDVNRYRDILNAYGLRK